MVSAVTATDALPFDCMSSALTVSRVNRSEVKREMAERAVAGGGARGAGGLDDLQHHRLAVVAHRHLHAAEPLRRRHARRAAPIPSSGINVQIKT